MDCKWSRNQRVWSSEIGHFKIFSSTAPEMFKCWRMQLAHASSASAHALQYVIICARNVRMCIAYFCTYFFVMYDSSESSYLEVLKESWASIWVVCAPKRAPAQDLHISNLFLRQIKSSTPQHNPQYACSHFKLARSEILTCTMIPRKVRTNDKYEGNHIK